MMTSIKFEDLLAMQEIYERYWKQVLVNMLNGIGAIYVTEEGSLLDNNKDSKNCLSFTKNIGLFKFLSYKFKKTNNYNTYSNEAKKTVLSSYVEFSLTAILERMVISKYLTKSNYKSEVSGQFYSLTDKGVEIALKLQEHSDNDRRHSTTTRLSYIAVGVSTMVLVAACFSGYQNHKRLNLYETQVNKLKCTQTKLKSDL